MPGGSVGGRPFRESSDSYQKTEIPCGNPKRYQSHEVVRFSEMKPGNDGRSATRRPLIGPVEDIETEGQRQLKQLVQKQLKTDLTLEQQLKQRKEFTGGAAFRSTTRLLSGVTSLSNFKDVEEQDSYIAELKQSGLTDEEVQMKIQQSQPQHEQSIKGNYGPDPKAHEKQMLEIERKIEVHKAAVSTPDTFSGQKELSRHEMDLERSLLSNIASRSVSTTLTKVGSFKKSLHPDDPMNHLPEILQSVAAAVEEKEGKRRSRKRRRRRKLKEEADRMWETEEEQVGYIIEDSPEDGCAERPIDWTTPHVDTTQNSKSETKILFDNVESIPDEFVIQHRISLEVIRQVPRFKNYSTGTPSKVLFIKNLSNKTSEKDLMSIFKKYHTSESNVSCRLCNGKMRGQAFVTFNDEKTASSALNFLNGLNFKGKPMVIEFGKK